MSFPKSNGINIEHFGDLSDLRKITVGRVQGAGGTKTRPTGDRAHRDVPPPSSPFPSFRSPAVLN